MKKILFISIMVYVSSIFYGCGVNVAGLMDTMMALAEAQAEADAKKLRLMESGQIYYEVSGVGEPGDLSPFNDCPDEIPNNQDGNRYNGKYVYSGKNWDGTPVWIMKGSPTEGYPFDNYLFYSNEKKLFIIQFSFPILETKETSGDSYCETMGSPAIPNDWGKLAFRAHVYAPMKSDFMDSPISNKLPIEPGNGAWQFPIRVKYIGPPM